MQIQRSSAARDAARACAAADQDRARADLESLTFQAETERNLALTRVKFEAEVKQQQVTAEKANEIHMHQLEQQIVAEKIKTEEMKRRLLLLEAQNQADATRIRGVAETQILRMKNEASVQMLKTALQGTTHETTLTGDALTELLSALNRTDPAPMGEVQEKNTNQLAELATLKETGREHQDTVFTDLLA
jgi:hypothetical protein